MSTELVSGPTVVIAGNFPVIAPKGDTGETGPQWSASGSAATPQVIDDDGVTWTGADRELHIISGGSVPVEVTADFPTAGASIGDERRLICLDPINTVKFNDGNGLDLSSDDVVLGAPGSRLIDLMFNGVSFMETGRR